MSRETADIELSADWRQVSENGNPICAVTIVGVLPVLLRIQAAKPAANEIRGIRLSSLHPFFSINDLAGSQKVWARAAGVYATIETN